MLIRRLRPALLGALAAVALGGAASAQPAETFDARASYADVVARSKVDPNYVVRMRQRFQFPGEPLPANAATLDELLKTGDHEGMFETLQAGFRNKDALQYLNWEREKVFDGGPLIVAVAYARDLWGMAEAAQEEPLRETALSMALYARALVEIEGLRCGDPAAPPYRQAQLDRVLAPIWAYGRKAPEVVRQRALFVAANTELMTAELRKADEYLCLGPPKDDLTEIFQGLEALGDKPAPLARRQDDLGTTYVVPRAPPKMRAPTEFRPRQEAARKRLVDLLETQLRKG